MPGLFRRFSMCAKKTTNQRSQRQQSTNAAANRHTIQPESAAWYAAIRTAIVAWFQQSGRDLPWRQTRDPYAIWVSEIMLQQTTVATVRPAYERFLTIFPDIQSLADATEEQVLRQWEGLGYYRRARQLHAAAQQIIAQHNGNFPQQPELIAALPGIGRYTLGAIAGFAFDLPLPIIEANTQRVWARLLGESRALTDKAAIERLWNAATKVLPTTSGTGALNQGLMELGSQVCLVKEPLCLLCPVQQLCNARHTNLVATIPAPKTKTNWTPRHEAALLFRRRDQILLVRYATGQRWAGLWDLPRVTLSVGESIPSITVKPGKKETTPGIDQALRQAVTELLKMKLKSPEHLTRTKHVVTRYQITLDLFSADAPANWSPKQINRERLSECRWVSVAELAEYPLSTTGRKLVNGWVG
jgi:A/G-specific adenine glycosylase